MTVGIYVFDEVEVLDFAGPFQVFFTAERMRSSESLPNTLFSPITISADGAPVTARGGLAIHPSHGTADHPELDIVVIPGGVVDKQLEVPDVVGWIFRVAQSAEICASVCTGAFLLARAGLLSGLAATTHWEDLDDFRRLFGDVELRRDARWVDNGKIITAAGISAGIDMSLHVVARLGGAALARKTAVQMDYAWNENSVTTSPSVSVP